MSSYVDIVQKRRSPRPIRSARDLGATVRGRRTELRLSQQRVAEAAGVSRQWLSELEAGKATAEVGLVLRVLDILHTALVPDVVSVEEAGAVGLDDVLDDYRHR